MDDAPALLLALDLATRTGVCVGVPGQKPRAWSYCLPSTGDEVGPFLDAYNDLLRGLLATHRVTHLVFEAPILRQGKTALITGRKLISLAGHTEWVAWGERLLCREAFGQQVTAYFTGRARFPGKNSYAKRAAKKRAVMEKCARLGWEVDDDDAGDAAAVWAYAEHIFFPAAREISPLFAAVGGVGLA